MYLYHCSVLYFCVLLGGLWSFLLLLLFSPLSDSCCCDALRVLAGLFLCLFFWMYHFNTVHILLPSQYNFVSSGIVVLLSRLCMLYPFLINEVPNHHTYQPYPIALLLSSGRFWPLLLNVPFSSRWLIFLSPTYTLRSDLHHSTWIYHSIAVDPW